MAKLVTLVLLIAPLACAAQHHVVGPHADDAGKPPTLEWRAEQRCSAAGKEDRSLPVRRFESDGCSLWLDGSWVECCIEHDQAYWCGGTAAERKQADQELRACIEATGSGWSAELVYLGVRVGGHPAFPTPYRWGYGRAYTPFYPEPREATGGAR